MNGTGTTPQADDANALLALGEAMIAARALQLIAELGIADHFGDSAATVEWLAERTGTIPSALQSFLRVLAGHGVVAELPDGRVELTARGALLRSDHPESLRSIVRLYGFDYDVLSHAEHSLRTGRPAFEKFSDRPLFEYLRENEGIGAVFDSAMADLSRIERGDILAGYDFSPYRHIVDVAGGDGTLLAAILAAHPEATGAVFEQEHVTARAKQTRAAHGLDARMDVVGGDFFDEVVPGGDLYLMKSIIHDWPREQAETILRRCHKAMADDARLVLFERVMFGDNAPSQAKSWDIVMLAMLGGRERTVDQFRDLFATSGFELAATKQLGPSLYAVEAVRVP